jgi:hypothetical protein
MKVSEIQKKYSNGNDKFRIFPTGISDRNRIVEAAKKVLTESGVNTEMYEKNPQGQVTFGWCGAAYFAVAIAGPEDDDPDIQIISEKVIPIFVWETLK